MERILASTIVTGVKCGKVDSSSLESVIVDTTIMEKAITHPTDSKLLHRGCSKLLKLAKSTGVELRQA
jgi:IS5 family transposase